MICMIRRWLYAILCFGFLNISAVTFEIVIGSYNNEQWCLQNLASAVIQAYDEFHITYIDDCSTDATGRLVDEFVQTHHFEDLITVIHNPHRLGALENRYRAIHALPATTVAVVLDGDDMLAHEHVLKRLNAVYSNYEVWMTFGQFEYWPTGKPSDLSREYSKDVIKKGEFRKTRNFPSHVRTYYAWLFQKIAKDDFMKDGKFFSMAGDVAEMLPMLEMAHERHAFIPDILYSYNTTNNISDFRVNNKLQQQLEGIIRSKPRYKRLEGIVMNPGKPAYYAGR
jgi:glycosyltransferase involved in cell wall biosynthesis